MQCVRGNADGRKDYKMKQKYYELSLLFYKDISESDISRVENNIRSKGWAIVKIVEEGVQRLAYAVDGQDFARRRFYVLKKKVDDGDKSWGDTPAKTSTMLNNEGAALSYLLLPVDPRFARKYDRLPELLPAEVQDETK